MFGNQERERKRREKRGNWKENESCAYVLKSEKLGLQTYKVAYIGHPMYENTREPNILANTRDNDVIHQNEVGWH